ncbi:hypothetical protein GCM10011506_17300 [Marivirga lumbricoides]|uniref:Leucine-rich repeat domain-containing protein n=1 Tax=Marivirga lumbricoides TaxID=1046115 RepID=A0ABQ1M208_9BACT|nr:hypothetical protein GCM10011506_17300 [Marivirga lumbricoides]
MKHHFADLLDREDDYWTIVPNIERYAYLADEIIDDKNDAHIVTVNKHNSNWKQIFNLPKLVELTLHEPSKEQVESIKELKNLKRLRISHYRANNIEFIRKLVNIEELVLEYVSGFSDLSPLGNLTKLKSLHLENLRRVSNFEGLSGILSLRYLHLDGTLDWSQPIENLEFLKGLQNLEVFALGFVKVQQEYPAFMPILELQNLKRIKIGLGTLDTKEYAFIQVAKPNVKCGAHGKHTPWSPISDWGEDEYIPLGKGKRSFSKYHKDAKAKCIQIESDFEKFKEQAKEILKK